jgi:1-aminocyclopropane-1-carboxylate deaminase/D-cysteine desulfhydrase-like pyridoxal-dependent ACC family enzyme
MRIKEERVTSHKALTPVQNVKGLYFKRDDLFQPFDITEVNGGKCRQCYCLVEHIKDNHAGVISCCSIHSPQAPITSAVARHFGMPCTIFYGGTTKERVNSLPMPRIVLQNGATIQIASKSGRHNILYNKAREYAEARNYFVVEYGFNIIDFADIMFSAVSNQVENIPDELDNLIITCGSGITTIGVILGIKKFNKKVNTLHLVCTAPSRKKLIEDAMKQHGIEMDIVYHDLFHRKGFVYEKGINVVYENIKLHPHYEAKAFSWLYHESGIDIHNNKNLFWIVGSMPEK